MVRHIKKIHQGFSQAIRFTEYIVGRFNGIYSVPRDIPKARPLFEKSEKASASDGDQIICEMIKVCKEMARAKQSFTSATYPTSAYHQEASQQQPSEIDKKMATVDKDPFLEAAKKMVDQCKVVKIKDPSLEAAKKKLDQLQINNVNVADKNSLNSLRTSTSQESDLEIARKGLERYFAQMDKNDGSKNP